MLKLHVNLQMKLVLSLGVSPDRIVLANCCKRPRDMRFAKEAGVRYTTFDTVSELQKLAELYPTCQALLRVRTDDVTARCQLGNKYGANPDDAATLLQVSYV
jgi:ornithine decarboxylase